MHFTLITRPKCKKLHIYKAYIYFHVQDHTNLKMQGVFKSFLSQPAYLLVLRLVKTPVLWLVNILVYS